MYIKPCIKHLVKWLTLGNHLISVSCRTLLTIIVIILDDGSEIQVIQLGRAETRLAGLDLNPVCVILLQTQQKRNLFLLVAGKHPVSIQNIALWLWESTQNLNPALSFSDFNPILWYSGLLTKCVSHDVD